MKKNAWQVTRMRWAIRLLRLRTVLTGRSIQRTSRSAQKRKVSPPLSEEVAELHLCCASQQSRQKVSVAQSVPGNESERIDVTVEGISLGKLVVFLFLGVLFCGCRFCHKLKRSAVHAVAFTCWLWTIIKHVA